METAKELNRKYLQTKILEIARILDTIQEAAEDTHTEHHFHDALKFFDDWNRELKPQPLKCRCGSDTWIQRQVVQIEAPGEDCGGGVRSCLSSRIQYICSKCKALLL